MVSAIRVRGWWVWSAGLMVSGLFVSASVAEDWTRWRGPNLDGISSETGWSTNWGADGPKQLWKASVGQGYSGVSTSQGRAYTMGNADGKDTVWCLNAETGEVVWRHDYPCQGGDHPGPRATPTVADGVVYFASYEGHVGALEAASGKVLWQKNVAEEAGVKPPRWGFSTSPLVDGNLVIVNISSAGVALNKATGQTVWKSEAGDASYATPVTAEIGGKRVVALFVAKGLSVVEAETGKQVWWHPWETKYDVNSADPVFSGNMVFISSGYNHAGALLKLEGGQPTVVWENQLLKNHCSGSVLLGGHLYGNDQGTLRCVSFETGEQKWEGPAVGSQAGLMAADGKLIAMTTKGELFVAEAKPDGYNELARAKVLGGDTWTHPVLANGRIFCRNHAGEVVCLDVR